MSPRKAARLSPRVLIGLFIILLGLAFTLDNFDVPIGSALREALVHGWPAIFILAGVARLFESRTACVQPGPYVWILVGSALLLHNYGYVDVERAWPLALVVGGAYIVWRSYVPPGAPPSDADDRIGALAVMGGTRRASSATDFRGGSLMAFMGGVEVDLTGARVPSGEAVIEAFTVWGGIEITVPRDWQVVSRGVALLGGFEDKTAVDEAGGGQRPRLIVNGLAVMGGVEIKN